MFQDLERGGECSEVVCTYCSRVQVGVVLLSWYAVVGEKVALLNKPVQCNNLSIVGSWILHIVGMQSINFYNPCASAYLISSFIMSNTEENSSTAPLPPPKSVKVSTKKGMKDIQATMACAQLLALSYFHSCEVLFHCIQCSVCSRMGLYPHIYCNSCSRPR